MREKVVTAMLLIVALIHLLPLAGVLGAARIEALYGIAISGPELELLMRHRAVLFGLLGGFIAYASFHASLQGMALLGSFVSVSSFFYFAAQLEEMNSAIRGIVIGDIVATLCWLVAFLCYVWPGKQEAS